jgi:hypothetical protein
VRGKTYLTDRKKVPSAEPALSLRAVELCTTAAADVLHISPFLPAVMHSSAAFLMPIHFTLPYAGKNMHLVCVFALEGLPEAQAAEEPFTAALGHFYAGCTAADDNRRSSALKLIPIVCPPPNFCCQVQCFSVIGTALFDVASNKQNRLSACRLPQCCAPPSSREALASAHRNSRADNQ